MMDTVGHILFSAPEMRVGYNEYSEQIDLWNAGILLYFMLCGDYPYSVNDNNDESLNKIKHGIFDFGNKVLSNEVKDLLKNLLNFDPNKRFSAFQALKHPWFGIDLKKEDSRVFVYDIKMGKSYDMIMKRYYNQTFINTFANFTIHLKSMSNTQRSKSLDSILFNLKRLRI